MELNQKNTSCNTSCTRFSVRLHKKVTSYNIPNHILAFYDLFNEVPATDILSDAIKDWDKETAKGLSIFMSTKLLSECLDTDTSKSYYDNIKTLR